MAKKQVKKTPKRKSTVEEKAPAKREPGRPRKPKAAKAKAKPKAKPKSVSKEKAADKTIRLLEDLKTTGIVRLLASQGWNARQSFATLQSLDLNPKFNTCIGQTYQFRSGLKPAPDTTKALASWLEKAAKAANPGEKPGQNAKRGRKPKAEAEKTRVSERPKAKRPASPKPKPKGKARKVKQKTFK